MLLENKQKTVFITAPEAEKTDEQIHQAAADEWMQTLMSLWDAVGKEIDSNRLTIYAGQLEIVPLGLLKKVVARAIRNNGQYQTVPTVGALWDAVRKELDLRPSEDTEEAIQRWCARMFDQAIYRFEPESQ
jgi:hypothetical protein